jgi:hypothetical protein
VARAPGFASKVTTIVGVPPKVTDLNIALHPLPNHLNMPAIMR